MDVRMDADAQRDRDPKAGKRRRPDGAAASAPSAVAVETGRLLSEREDQWLERLVRDPASFAAIEREVHEQTRLQADRYVAGLLAKASQRPEAAAHVGQGIAAAEAPL